LLELEKICLSINFKYKVLSLLHMTLNYLDELIEFLRDHEEIDIVNEIHNEDWDRPGFDLLEQEGQNWYFKFVEIGETFVEHRFGTKGLIRIYDSNLEHVCDYSVGHDLLDFEKVSYLIDATDVKKSTLRKKLGQHIHDLLGGIINPEDLELLKFEINIKTPHSGAYVELSIHYNENTVSSDYIPNHYPTETPSDNYRKPSPLAKSIRQELDSLGLTEVAK